MRCVRLAGEEEGFRGDRRAGGTLGECQSTMLRWLFMTVQKLCISFYENVALCCPLKASLLHLIRYCTNHKHGCTFTSQIPISFLSFLVSYWFFLLFLSIYERVLVPCREDEDRDVAAAMKASMATRRQEERVPTQDRGSMHERGGGMHERGGGGGGGMHERGGGRGGGMQERGERMHERGGGRGGGMQERGGGMHERGGGMHERGGGMHGRGSMHERGGAIHEMGAMHERGPPKYLREERAERTEPEEPRNMSAQIKPPGERREIFKV